MSAVNGVKNYGGASPAQEEDFDVSGKEYSGDIEGSEDASDYYGSDFEIGDEEQDLGDLESSQGSMTVADARAQLKELIKQMTPEQKKQFKDQIESLQDSLSKADGKSICSGAILEGFYSLQSQVLGGDGSGEGMDGEDPSSSQQIDALKKQIEDSKLEDDEKQALLTELSAVNDLKGLNPDSVQEKIDKITEDFTTKNSYSKAARGLAQELGMEDPAIAQGLIDKYKIDPKNPDPTALQQLSQDPAVAEYFTEEKINLDKAVKDASDKISADITACAAQNQATDGKDTSKDLAVDSQPFFRLNSASNGTGEIVQGIADAANNYANKVTRLFSSMGIQATASTDPKQAGNFTLSNGTTMNVLSKGSSSGIAMGSSTLTALIPKFDLPEFHADLEGDGQTTIPDWMKNSSYPIHSTDDGGVFPFFTPFVPIGNGHYDAGDGHGEEGGLNWF